MGRTSPGGRQSRAPEFGEKADVWGDVMRVERNRGQTMWCWACLALVIALLLAGCGRQEPTASATVIPQEPAPYPELARHYAPVIRHGTASDQDYLTAADFDGDWIGNNNWENQPSGDLSAFVYYSVIETGTHWYLFYSLYHPRDYTDDPCEKSEGCHENDMESLEVVVAKDGSAFGNPLALLTLAHNNIHLYGIDSAVRKGALRVEASVTMEDGHPVVWVETYGHGIYGGPQIMVPGVVHYRAGDKAEIPEGIKDDDVRYELVSIYDTLWQHRDEIGEGLAFDQPFDYRGRVLPASFDGENWGEDKANPPWGYNQEIGRTLLRGDFFLDPAKAVEYFANLPGELSKEYVHNPFLEDLGLISVP
jgi:hypothetical protein